MRGSPVPPGDTKTFVKSASEGSIPGGSQKGGMGYGTFEGPYAEMASGGNAGVGASRRAGTWGVSGFQSALGGILQDPRAPLEAPQHGEPANPHAEGRGDGRPVHGKDLVGTSPALKAASWSDVFRANSQGDADRLAVADVSRSAGQAGEGEFLSSNHYPLRKTPAVVLPAGPGQGRGRRGYSGIPQGSQLVQPGSVESGYGSFDPSSWSSLGRVAEDMEMDVEPCGDIKTPRQHQSHMQYGGRRAGLVSPGTSPGFGLFRVPSWASDMVMGEMEVDTVPETSLFPPNQQPGGRAPTGDEPVSDKQEVPGTGDACPEPQRHGAVQGDTGSGGEGAVGEGGGRGGNCSGSREKELHAIARSQSTVEKDASLAEVARSSSEGTWGPAADVAPARLAEKSDVEFDSIREKIALLTLTRARAARHCQEFTDEIEAALTRRQSRQLPRSSSVAAISQGSGINEDSSGIGRQRYHHRRRGLRRLHSVDPQMSEFAAGSWSGSQSTSSLTGLRGRRSPRKSSHRARPGPCKSGPIMLGATASGDMQLSGSGSESESTAKRGHPRPGRAKRNLPGTIGAPPDPSPGGLSGQQRGMQLPRPGRDPGSSPAVMASGPQQDRGRRLGAAALHAGPTSSQDTTQLASSRGRISPISPFSAAITSGDVLGRVIAPMPHGRAPLPASLRGLKGLSPSPAQQTEGVADLDRWPAYQKAGLKGHTGLEANQSEGWSSGPLTSPQLGFPVKGQRSSDQIRSEDQGQSSSKLVARRPGSGLSLQQEGQTPWNMGMPGQRGPNALSARGNPGPMRSGYEVDSEESSGGRNDNDDGPFLFLD